MSEEASNGKDDKQKLVRCMEWLQKQNNEDTEKLSLENKNDIQFIIQTHAARKNFLLAVAEDDATVPSGINEPSLEPRSVSRYKLRVANLQMECEWQSCRHNFIDYDLYQKHVRNHSSDVHVIEKDSGVEYVCLWDVCGHKTSDFNEMVRHLNYHAYHGKLLAIGFNGRATLKLAPCKKDSSKRNQIPIQVNDYVCMWIGCEEQSKYNSMQHIIKINTLEDIRDFKSGGRAAGGTKFAGSARNVQIDVGLNKLQRFTLFLDHVKVHANYSENFLCSWAGCGAIFPRKEMLNVHVRTHTGERLIACYHCGQHFANNRKLSDHLRRQNVYPNSPFVCELCGTRCATEYLLGEHTRQHISTYACTLCDMSATSPAALANHVRYRHLARKDTRTHACPHCEYKAITKSDLRQHILTHKKKKKKTKQIKKEIDPLSDEDNSDSDCYEVKKEKKGASVRKYACHLCPEKNMKIFSRGNRLTTHLVKEHGAQWSFGHSRFRYQISEDGMHRLTTTRYESLEVSEKIMDGYSSPNVPLTSLDFKLKQVANPTAFTPRCFEITLKNEDDEMEVDKKPVINDNGVEILMCDVDEEGNIISSEVIDNQSDLIPKLER